MRSVMRLIRCSRTAARSTARTVSRTATPNRRLEPDSPRQHVVATDGGEPEVEITGPHMEPAELSNATTFWRCEDCGYESIRKQDTERTTFHAVGCSQR